MQIPSRPLLLLLTSLLATSTLATPASGPQDVNSLSPHDLPPSPPPGKIDFEALNKEIREKGSSHDLTFRLQTPMKEQEPRACYTVDIPGTPGNPGWTLFPDPLQWVIVGGRGMESGFGLEEKKNGGTEDWKHGMDIFNGFEEVMNMSMNRKHET
ncbi:hypothetical protein BZA77DRAFT_293563 [Pyronema omphalodes]|nr:hypothetical protein BZA77DRAFT_293563 [Pyronema omphalodes]